MGVSEGVRWKHRNQFHGAGVRDYLRWGWWDLSEIKENVQALCRPRYHRIACDPVQGDSFTVKANMLPPQPIRKWFYRVRHLIIYSCHKTVLIAIKYLYDVEFTKHNYIWGAVSKSGIKKRESKNGLRKMRAKRSQNEGKTRRLYCILQYNNTIEERIFII